MGDENKMWDESTAAAVADNVNSDSVEDEKEHKTVSVPLNAYDVAFQGADYPVDGLVKRLKSGSIGIPKIGDEVPDDESDEDNKDTIEGFQREFVWPRAQSDKFIESLLMGLPVPGIFLAKTAGNVLLVLDGQQRLITLQRFYDNKLALGKLVQETYHGKTYETLSEKEKRRLDDSFIHTTIVRQKSPQGFGSLYHIFERLNSGGKILKPQQIRMALHHGGFAKMLIELNKNEIWRKLMGRDAPDSTLKDMEMILRFFALFHDFNNYKNPMKDFLNKFMNDHDDMDDSEQKRYEELFCRTITFIYEFIGKHAFYGKGKKPSAAIVDSLMYGVSKRIVGGIPDRPPQEIKDAMDNLLENLEYQNAIGERTSVAEHVWQRLNLSEQAFCNQ